MNFVKIRERKARKKSEDICRREEAEEEAPSLLLNILYAVPIGRD